MALRKLIFDINGEFIVKSQKRHVKQTKKQNNVLYLMQTK